MPRMYHDHKRTDSSLYKGIDQPKKRGGWQGLLTIPICIACIALITNEAAPPKVTRAKNTATSSDVMRVHLSEDQLFQLLSQK